MPDLFALSAIILWSIIVIFIAFRVIRWLIGPSVAVAAQPANHQGQTFIGAFLYTLVGVICAGIPVLLVLWYVLPTTSPPVQTTDPVTEAVRDTRPVSLPTSSTVPAERVENNNEAVILQKEEPAPQIMPTLPLPVQLSPRLDAEEKRPIETETHVSLASNNIPSPPPPPPPPPARPDVEARVEAKSENAIAPVPRTVETRQEPAEKPAKEKAASRSPVKIPVKTIPVKVLKKGFYQVTVGGDILPGAGPGIFPTLILIGVDKEGRSGIREKTITSVQKTDDGNFQLEVFLNRPVPVNSSSYVIFDLGRGPIDVIGSELLAQGDLVPKKVKVRSLDKKRYERLIFQAPKRPGWISKTLHAGFTYGVPSALGFLAGGPAGAIIPVANTIIYKKLRNAQRAAAMLAAN